MLIVTLWRSSVPVKSSLVNWLTADQRWSLDFVSDQLTDERRFRILAVVDDCTALIADTSISGRRVASFVSGQRLDTIVSDKR
jgi:putative transposase